MSEIFSLNIPKYFAKNEIDDFKKYREQKLENYLTTVIENSIVGGTGYFINEDYKSGRITWIFFDVN
ncbi:hypothetical protein [Arenibacter nanhaiticus]|uniref:hypothetical protein n=1 Tax=Arenibacter nanhaiticus TaxID=558155 RepID=UPI000933C403|nr:hypothetical protein [Arenibacter nanhaiticus]